MTRATSGECTLFTGPSGLQTIRALTKLADYAERQGVTKPLIRKLEDGMAKCHTDRFPGDPSLRLIAAAGGFQHLLMEPKEYLRSLWRQSVDECMQQVRDNSQSLFVSMHAVFHHTGSRDFFQCADIDHLAGVLNGKGYRITRVITLIDDIFDMWRRLAEPGQLFDGTKDLGQSALDLLQILTWRSIEIFAAEEIAAKLKARHYLLAIKHPLSVAFDIIFTTKTPVYIAHPISEVRMLQQQGRNQEANAAENEITELTNLLLNSRTLVPFFPTTIDEFVIKADPSTSQNYIPEVLPRWSFLPEDRTLYSAPNAQIAEPLSLPTPTGNGEQSVRWLLTALMEAIRMQVNSRDKKLVEKSQGLVIWRPCFNGDPSGGVYQELLHRSKLVERELQQPESRKAFALIRLEDLGRLRLKNTPELLRKRGAKLPDGFEEQVRERVGNDALIGRLDAEAPALTGDEVRAALDPSESVSFPLSREARSALGPEQRVAQRQERARQWEEIAQEICSESLNLKLLPTDTVLYDSRITVPEFVRLVEQEMQGSS